MNRDSVINIVETVSVIHPLAIKWSAFCSGKAAKFKAMKKGTPEIFRTTRINANAPGWKSFKKQNQRKAYT